MLKTILFQQFHIAQFKAKTPMRILALVLALYHSTNFQTNW
jgi:hypothetical protein